MSMSNDDRAAIDQLFGRLADTERRSPPRDADAEAFIRDHVGRQPGAPYFMAQTIVVQDHALKEAERHIADLEARLAARDQPGSLSPSGFGASPRSAAPPPATQGGPWSQPQPAAAAGNWPQNPAPPAAPQASPFGGGGGFLAGAAQTAMGVAGGMLIGNVVSRMFGGFGGGERVVEEPEVVKEDVFVNDDQQATADAAPADDGGGFFDGLFGGDDDTV